MNAKNWIAGLLGLAGLFMCVAGLVALGPGAHRSNPIQASGLVIVGVGLFIYARKLDQSAKK